VGFEAEICRKGPNYTFIKCTLDPQKEPKTRTPASKGCSKKKKKKKKGTYHSASLGTLLKD